MIINCIIQARAGSTRLPNKVMEKLGESTVLGMVAERCLQAKTIDKVIVAGHNIGVGKKIKDKGVKVIRGPEEPAARFLMALREHPCDGFVRVCADSPFLDPPNIDEAADAIRSGENYALIGNRRGNHAEGFNTKAFLLFEPKMCDDEREHLGLIFQKSHGIAIDDFVDLELARLIVSRMDKPHTEYTFDECMGLLCELT